MRYVLFYEIFNKDHFSSLANRGGQITKIRNKAIFALNSILKVSKNPFFGKQKEILFFGHSRNIVEDDEWIDKYTHYFLRDLGFTYIFLENSVGFKHNPTNNKNVKYSDYFVTLSNIANYLKYRSIALTHKELEDIEFIQNILDQNFENVPRILPKIIRIIKTWKSQIKIYTKLLKKIKPKIVIVVVGYGKEALIKVSNDLGIKTIELQHGVLSDYNIAYSIPSDVTTIQTNYLFTFGNYWNTKTNFHGKCELRISGFPYIEKRRSLYSENKKEKIILFISQPAVGKELANLAVECMKALPEDYKIIYKLHRFEHDIWEREYPIFKNLICARFEVIGRNSDLYELFSRSIIQIGVYSTAIFEGLYFGLRTLIYQTDLADHVSELIDTKVAIPIHNSEDIINYLHTIQASDDIPIPEFFANNGIDKFHSEIREIMNS